MDKTTYAKFETLVEKIDADETAFTIDDFLFSVVPIHKGKFIYTIKLFSNDKIPDWNHSMGLIGIVSDDGTIYAFEEMAFLFGPHCHEDGYPDGIEIFNEDIYNDVFMKKLCSLAEEDGIQEEAQKAVASKEAWYTLLNLDWGISGMNHLINPLTKKQVIRILVGETDLQSYIYALYNKEQKRVKQYCATQKLVKEYRKEFLDCPLYKLGTALTDPNIVNVQVTFRYESKDGIREATAPMNRQTLFNHICDQHPFETTKRTIRTWDFASRREGSMLLDKLFDRTEAFSRNLYLDMITKVTYRGKSIFEKAA